MREFEEQEYGQVGQESYGRWGTEPGSIQDERWEAWTDRPRAA